MSYMLVQNFTHRSMKKENLFLSTLNLGDFVIAAMKTIEWKWCCMISEAGSEKVTWLVSNLSHVGHLPLEPSHHPMRVGYTWRKTEALSQQPASPPHTGVNEASADSSPQLLRCSVSCTLSKFLTQNLLYYDKLYHQILGSGFYGKSCLIW